MYITSGPTNVAALDLKSGKPLWEWNRADRRRACSTSGSRASTAAWRSSTTPSTSARSTATWSRSTRRPAPSAGRCTSATTRPVTRSPPRRSSSTTRSSSASAAAKRASAGSSTPTTRRPASRRGASGPCRRRANPGARSWPGDSWVHGGGATWLTGSYDPALKLLYWGTGNPGPDWNGDSRKGDNLYTSSLVAIDVDDRKGALAFSVHAARRARLGCEPDSGARRRRRPRYADERSS